MLSFLARTVVVLAAVVGAGYWLAADTVEYYQPKGQGPLRISFWGPYEEFEMWKTLLTDFERESGVAIKMEYMPGTGYDQKIQRLLVADDAPDVILFQDEPFPKFVDSGKFMDITELIREHWGDEAATLKGLQKRYWDTAVESFGRWEGEGDERQWRMYGLPIWGGCNLLFYNKACFDRVAIRIEAHDGEGAIKVVPGRGNEAQPDLWLVDDDRWTLTDFIKVCERLTIRDPQTGRASQYGYSLGYWGYWAPFHYTLGAGFLNEELTRTTFYGPEVEASLALYRDLRWKYRVAPTPTELGTMNDDTGFFTGRIAICNTGPWGMPFRNAAASEGLEYDVLHMPRNDMTQTNRGGRATRITWDAVVIFEGSKQKEKAWQLIAYLTSQEAQRVIARVQRSIPAARPPAEVEQRAIVANKPTQADRERYAAVEFMMLNPKVSVRKFLIAAGDYAQMQPITTYWSEMAGAWQEAMDGMQRTDESKRFTPAEAIGRFYADQGRAARLRQLLPPAEPATAAKYRAEFEESGKPG